MITKMKKYDIKDFTMNGKTLLTACLTVLLGLSGCALFQKTPPTQNTVQADADPQLCPEGGCETDPFINYTQTRADYRQYGELSERDVVVSQAGAGNNLSAAIPPSVENEVIEYEEYVETEASQTKQAEAEAEARVETVAVDSGSPSENIVSAQNNGATIINPAQDGNNTIETVALPASVEPLSENQVVPEAAKTEDMNTTENVAENIVENENVAEDNNVAEENQQEEDDEDDEDPVRDWYAEEGQNLKALLTEWSNESGWRIVWNTNRNYILNAGAMFRGRFADVSSALIRAFARARPAPIATFYKGNRVLVVETMEDENAYD